VGGTTTHQVDVRILAATNKDLKDEVDQGRFREDLYYRLNVIHIHLPPLRERVDDIPALVSHFLEKNMERFRRERLEISPEALRLLVSLPWEGNVRELENTIEPATGSSRKTSSLILPSCRAILSGVQGLICISSFRRI